MAVTQATPVPYAPSSAILEVISRRRHRGLPIPINGDVLGRASISPSLIPRTLQALQILDLIDDAGNPTAIFEAIRTAPEAEYQQRLEAWLKGTYAEVFAFVDPATDDEVRIRDAFRNYDPAGQQERMVTLFMGLCSAAGLVPDKPRSAPRPQVIPRPRTSAPVRVGILKSPVSPGSLRKYQAPQLSTSLPPALSGLLESLPDASDGWSATERDKFMTTFKAVLDFCIPVVTARPKTENDGREGPS
jgi:hypothetical protein